MCGIAGFISQKHNYSNQEISNILKKMGDQIHHRGPDNQGFWCASDFNLGFVHQRLSILDLSNAGNQPMKSHAGRFIITFNGEIYNHMSLRKKIDRKYSRYQWNGHSDTETILAMFEIFGIKSAIKQFKGMFSLAVFDKAKKTLTLCRDRVGEKPLYFGFQTGDGTKNFIFGSELKSLCSHPSFENKIDRQALKQFLKNSYIPAPLSIYQNIKKLIPGTILTLSLENFSQEIEYFWDPHQLTLASNHQSYEGDIHDSLNDFKDILSNSVKEQMVSDVPLGVFLSGGIDSSLITCLMQEHSLNPIKTFTIGFEEDNFNEAQYAKSVAMQLGTNHTDLYISPTDAMSVISKLPSIFCEPFADQAQIPNFLVSELASKSVKVCLSGDGGDELFAGYNRYFAANNTWNKIDHIPFAIRSMLSFILQNISKHDRLGKNDKLLYYQKALESKNLVDFYDLFITQNLKYDKTVVSDLITTHETHLVENANHLNPIEKMMFFDTIKYLPDAILAKVDRSSMAVSLETRAPFLDHHLIEFAWKLPIEYKYFNNVPKWHLKTVLNKYLTDDIVNREKHGFSVPLNQWISGPLKPWADELLDPVKIKKNKILDWEIINYKWKEHLKGKKNNIHFLWPILIFLSWSEGKSFN